jgi:mannan endo-1,4-beta-mannosidase
MYDRLVNHHKLNNLIWVWTSQTSADDGVADSTWYPGDEYVDVVGRDSYYALQYPLMKEYNALSSMFPGKLVTLAECGNGDEVRMSPWSKIWRQGSRWCWFMTWYDYNYNAGQSQEHKYAGKDWWTDAFNSGTVLDRDAFRQLRGGSHKYVLVKDNQVL